MSSTVHVDIAVLFPRIAIPNAVDVTVSFPVVLPPARTVTFVSVPTKDCSVALTPASHSASQPVGSGLGGGKKVNPVKVLPAGNLINAILQMLIRSEIAPEELAKLNIVSFVMPPALPAIYMSDTTAQRASP
jgi:hypothetical protein